LKGDTQREQERETGRERKGEGDREGDSFFKASLHSIQKLIN
jgi:hypothetical protein